MSADRIAELEAQVSRLERALDKRLDPEHVRVAQSFTGCSEDRCPRAAQEAIAALILHAQALTAAMEAVVAAAECVPDLLAAAKFAAKVTKADHDAYPWVCSHEDSHEALRRLHAAIAKAEGGAP